MTNPIEISQTKDYGDMALCNLCSINLVEFRKANNTQKDFICKMAVRGLDDAITNGLCPIAEGAISNELYRYIGVGMLNAANALALEQIEIDTQEAAEWFDEVTEDLCYRLYYQSMLLSKERGRFPRFDETKWAEGLTPVHMSRKFYPGAWALTEFGKNFEKNGYLDKWNKLRELIKENGIRHAQVWAIAPTANSGKAINATESTEPVMGLMYKEEGMSNVVTLAPNIRKNMAYYKPAFDCDQFGLVLNAIVRQKYGDQAQSITLYFKDVSSLKMLSKIHNFGFVNGVKTFYYVKQPKNLDLDDCVSCAV